MCGIVGYVGDKQALRVVVDGLRRMEYRGYDSAGIAIVADGVRPEFGQVGGRGDGFQVRQHLLGVAGQAMGQHLARQPEMRPQPRLLYVNNRRRRTCAQHCLRSLYIQRFPHIQAVLVLRRKL